MIRASRLVLWSALTLCTSAAQAVDVADEFTKITSTFSRQLDEAGNKREAYGEAIAERNESLTKLVATAETEKSTEHELLAQIYLLLQRPADAVRQARAAATAQPDGVGALVVLTAALAEQTPIAEAEAAFQQLLSLEVSDANRYAFIATTPRALSALVNGLNSANGFDKSIEWMDKWQAKIDAVKNDESGVQQAAANARRLVDSYKARTAAEKARAELVGKPYYPIEQPTWVNGDALSPEQLHGKVTLLDFWAVWCGPCIATFPHLTEWHDKYADKGLVIVGITKRYGYDWDAEARRPSHKEGLEPAKEDAATLEFAKHYGLKHRLAVMNDSDLSRKYGVTGIPQVVLIDQSGIIRLVKVGSGDATAKAVETEIRKLLGMETAAATP